MFWALLYSCTWEAPLKTLKQLPIRLSTSKEKSTTTISTPPACFILDLLNVSCIFPVRHARLGESIVCFYLFVCWSLSKSKLFAFIHASVIAAIPYIADKASLLLLVGGSRKTNRQHYINYRYVLIRYTYIYIYLEPKWPLFWMVNPSILWVKTLKTRVIWVPGIYIYTHNIGYPMSVHPLYPHQMEVSEVMWYPQVTIGFNTKSWSSITTGWWLGLLLWLRKPPQ